MSNVSNISEGCNTCQQGKWLCIFLTYKCSAKCHFCPAPHNEDRIQTAFGNKKEEILPFLLDNDFKGLSFSGGDPFVVFDRLLEWFTYFKKHLPDYYYWVYTNGLDVNKQKLEQLATAGMNEIRFNIAATGYNSPQIWEKIKLARNMFPFVSIEIPSIKSDYGLLLKAIDKMEKNRIDYLNLHDYIISEKDLNTQNEAFESFTLNKVMKLKYSLSSHSNTCNIANYINEKGYNIKVNHCSMQQKELQMLRRRLKFGKIFFNPEYDLMLDDGIICNYFSIPNSTYLKISAKKIYNCLSNSSLDSYRIKIKQLKDIKSQGFTAIVVRFIPQIEINHRKVFLDFSQVK